MAAIFTPAANGMARGALAAVALLLVVLIGFWLTWPSSLYMRKVGFFVDQPVPFSHQHHVAGLGIDCRYCHSTVEVSADAGMPSTQTCMTCHSQIWTNAKMLAVDRLSLADNTPIVWSRVTNLPDYVYFNHSIHIAKGVGCESCHGQIDEMPLTYKAKKLTMQFCLNCHRNPGPQLRPQSAIFNTSWTRDATTPTPQQLVDFYHVGGRRLTDCSICHR
jgi:Cytochrome c7 and related cytochrome c